jgi:hypothetical protein
MALCDRKIRVSKETLLEQIEVCLILLVLRRIFYNKINNFFNPFDKWKKY